MSIDYLRRILTARVYDVAIESPLEPAPTLTRRIGHRVFLKREDLQPVFSFKLRGAYNCMVRLSSEQRARGVLTASAGNHAQGVAMAASRLGCRAVIVMPETTPSVKVRAVADRGAEVVLHGESYTDAYLHAVELQQAQGLTFVHPFDDPDVIAGQGTIGMEILRQHQDRLDAVFTPIGGGGLAAGVAAYIKNVRPDVKVIGVQTRDSHAMLDSIDAGHPVEVRQVGLFADGTAVRRVGDETFRLCAALLDEIVCVDTDALCAAIKDVFTDTRAIVEPSGALAVAGLRAWVRAQSGKTAGEAAVEPMTLVAITSGANMNFDRLRFVSERADVGEQREAVYAVTIPEERGSFRRFCKLLGPRNVTEFNYRIAQGDIAHLFVTVQIEHPDEADELLAGLGRAGFDGINLSGDDLAQSHIRYMVGGRSPLARDEIVMRCEFPERPGALMRFLESMNPAWNISMFNYRNGGGEFASILVGVQVPPSDHAAFEAFMEGLGYRHWNVSGHPAYRMFLSAAG